MPGTSIIRLGFSLPKSCSTSRRGTGIDTLREAIFSPPTSRLVLGVDVDVEDEAAEAAEDAMPIKGEDEDCMGIIASGVGYQAVCVLRVALVCGWAVVSDLYRIGDPQSSRGQNRTGAVVEMNGAESLGTHEHAHTLISNQVIDR